MSSCESIRRDGAGWRAQAIIDGHSVQCAQFGDDPVCPKRETAGDSLDLGWMDMYDEGEYDCIAHCSRNCWRCSPGEVEPSSIPSPRHVPAGPVCGPVVLKAPNGLLLREETTPDGQGWTSILGEARSWPGRAEARAWLRRMQPMMAKWLARDEMQLEGLDAARARLGGR